MSATTEIQGVVLSYVTRLVTGEVLTTQTRYDVDDQELKTQELSIEEPVIVFFPNGTSQVFASKNAAKKGFLETPEILNFASVEDQKTPAGRFKFAIRDDQRRQAWLDMEENVVRRVLSKSGNPLPAGVDYEKKSLFFSERTAK